MRTYFSHPEWRCTVDFGAGLQSARHAPAFFVRAKSKAAADRIFRDRFPRETQGRPTLVSRSDGPLLVD